MDVMDLLDELEGMIEERKLLPRKQEMLEVMQEIRIALPDEIKQAQWIKDEKQQILYDAKKEADLMISSARDRVDRLVDENEIKIEAEAVGNKIIEDAKREADFIISGAYEYSDELFKTVEKKLQDMKDTMEQNRLTLQKMSEKRQ